ncbi:MAG TPA: PQQ-binding-like beta-propeller repeat protein [Anaerolineales bacterium]|nr:PQQ-binding-like beta-propeller repeat protein [Anaerolineales bacterium]
MKRLMFISFALLGAMLLSACSGAASRGTSWPGLAADAKNAYLANGQFIYAARLSDGSKLWQYPDKGGAQEFFATPLLTPDGQLVVGSAGTDQGLISLDPATGQQKWVFSAAQDRWIAAPLAVNDTLYAPNNDGSLYALKLATGDLLWSLSIGHPLWGTPVTDGKLIFLTSLDHFLYAVDPQSHRIVWKTDLGGSAAGSPTLSTDKTTLYVGSFGSRVFAINAADGSIRWTAKTNAWVWSDPSVNSSNVYVADINGQVYSLDASSGQDSWSNITPDGPITGSPLLTTDGVIITTESGFIYSLDHNGKELWSTSIGGKIYTAPVASGNLVLIAPLGAQYLLYAVNEKDGSMLPWHFDGK